MNDEKLNPKNIDNILAPPAINVSSNFIQIGDQYIRSFFITTYPRFLNTNWFSPIVNLEKAFDVSIFIHPQNSAVVLKQLRDKLGRLEAEATEEATAGKVRNPVLETAIDDIEALRDKLQQGTERFLELGVYISIYGNSVKEIEETETKIKNIFESQLIFSKPATFRMKEGFTSTLPLNTDELGIHTSMNTEPVSSIFPFVSYNLTSDKGILYGINTHNNSLILFDRFSLENFNSVVFGKSGGGKSYTLKLEILRSMVFGTQVFVIDPENEFRFLAETVNGTSVKISISSGEHINPFDLPRPRPDESPEDVFRSHILNLTGLIKLMVGETTAEESGIIDEALIQTYALKDIGASTGYKATEPPLMSDFQNVLEGMTGTASLVTRIKKYTEGTFRGFLNNPTNVSLDNQLVVFSIRDMEEELRPIAMYLVLNFIWASVRAELKRRLLVVDEAWLLLKYEAGANFLLSIAKRARKYYLGLTTISQDVPEFLSSPYGKPVLTNSSIQILLRQSPATIDIVKETFNLTDAEKFFLLEARVGHGLFFAGQNHIGMRVVASYAEDQIITSDPRQLLEIEEAKKELAKQG